MEYVKYKNAVDRIKIIESKLQTGEGTGNRSCRGFQAGENKSAEDKKQVMDKQKELDETKNIEVNSGSIAAAYLPFRPRLAQRPYEIPDIERMEKDLLDLKLNEKFLELDKINSEIKDYNNYQLNIKIKTARIKLKESEQWKKYSEYVEYKAKLEDLQNQIKEIEGKLIEDKIGKDNINTATAACQPYDTTVIDISKMENDLKNYELAIKFERLDKLNLEIKNYNEYLNNQKIILAKEKMLAYNKFKEYSEYIESVREYNYQEEIRNKLQKIEKYKQYLKSKEEKDKLNKQLSEIQNEISEILLSIKEEEINIKNNQIYEKDILPLKKELEVIQLHHDLLNKKDSLFTKKIIEDNINTFVKITNSILQDIATFEMTAKFEDGNFELGFDEKNNSKVKPISHGSGYQVFVISLASRIALTMMLGISPQFIILDEGLGKLDSKHLDQIKSLFSVIKERFKFKFILIVTHMPEFISVFDDMLTIKQYTINNDDVCSQIKYNGDTKLNTLNMFDDKKDIDEIGEETEIDNDIIKIDPTKINKSNSNESKETKNNSDETKDNLKQDEKKYVCVCGAVIKNNKSSINIHNKSTKHQSFVNNKSKLV